MKRLLLILFLTITCSSMSAIEKQYLSLNKEKEILLKSVILLMGIYNIIKIGYVDQEFGIKEGALVIGLMASILLAGTHESNNIHDNGIKAGTLLVSLACTIGLYSTLLHY